MNKKFLTCAAAASLCFALSLAAQDLKINDLGYFEETGFNVLVYSNQYAGIFAAVGMAFAGIGLAIQGILNGVRGFSWWQWLVLIAAIMLIISGPSCFLAWLKLRKRNLGPVLNANGWAINGRVRVNVPFGGALTKVAELPAGSGREVGADPYADKPTRWWLWALLLILIALGVGWAMGKLDPYLPPSVQAATLLPQPLFGTAAAPSAAPAAPAPAPAAP